MKLHTAQVGAAGEHFVAAEIHRRGGYAVTFSGNMKGIDLLASDAAHHRKISIQVKTKTAGSWHANIGRDAHPRNEDPTEERFWIFVDLNQDRPEYYIAPAWWVQNDIFEHHRAYLERHGGKRAINNESQHHAIQVNRLLDWKARWDILGIFEAAG
jgi:Holliday junction resolvase-like predicted endonuclease